MPLTDTRNEEIYTFPEDPQDSPEDFPFLRQDYNPNDETVLCHLCRQLNFDYLPKNETNVKIHLGTYADVVLRREQCEICKAMVDKPWSSSLSDSGPPEDVDTLFVEADENQVQYTFWNTTEVSLGVGNRILGASRELNFHDGREGKLQTFDTAYNPITVRQWLDTCGKVDHLTGGPRNVEQQMVSIKRFIDVQQECLIETSSIHHAPVFAALSYVWGMQQTITCTKDYIERLHEPRFLASTNTHIPQTIRDAITVCKDVGVPLLWVDALCIQQDNTTEMIEQVRNMHRVYENAAFTIVALSGDSAEAGIAGVEDGSRKKQTVIKVQGFELILEELPLEGVLPSTRWATRAWTYQEFVLAPKRVVFASDMVYFVCSHGVFREDHIEHHKSTEKLSWWNRLEGYQLDWDASNWALYTELVESYTSKNLTHREDAIAAFTAVTEVIKRDYFHDSDFNWEIPSMYLDAALLWRRCLGCHCENENAGLRARNTIITLTGNREFAPSWSWLSRQGHVKYSSWFLNYKDPSLSVISRVRWLKDMLRSEGLLYLEADIAVFTVKGRRFKFDTPPREKGSYELPNGSFCFGGEIGHPLEIIEGNTGSHCGVVYDDEEVQGLPREFTFVKLSQTTLAEITDSRWFQGDNECSEILPGPGKDRLRHVQWRQKSSWEKGLETSNTAAEAKQRVGPKKDLLHSFFDYDKYDCESKWPVYNVLMVEQSRDRIVRLGVGKIHVDAFDNAESFESKRLCLN